MNILPHILNFSTTNFILNMALDNFKHKLLDCLKKYLFDFSAYSYVSFFLNLQYNVFTEINKLIIEFFKVVDDTYRESPERKKVAYINIKEKPRTLVTIFGELTFSRTYYKYKNEDKYFYYLDEILKLPKYDTYDPIVKAIAIDDAVNFNANNASYHSSLRTLNILHSVSNSINMIPRQSIYRWLRNTKITNINYDPINNGKTLYVMADEKWIHEQDKNNNEKKKRYIMSKCFIVFTHIKSKGKRNTLKGKHVFITTSSNPYKELMDEICKIYDFEKVETINLLSDAGSWILAGKSELKLYAKNNIVVNTCEFHVKQKINRSTTDKDLRRQLYNIIYDEEDKEKFIATMQDIVNNNPKQTRKDTITEYMNYILKHWKGIIAMKYCPCKSSMESHISHCIAANFGSRPKAYSRANIQVYLKLKEAALNGINIIDYYLKSIFADDNFIYNEKETDFSIFDHSISNLPALNSSTNLALALRALS